jgi:hypothetical protein
MKQEQQMAEYFNVEELEERLEFADWSASAEGSADSSGGFMVEAEVSASW